MTKFSDDIIAAQESIADAGETVRWIETVPGGVNPLKEWETLPPTETEYAPTVVFLPIKRVRNSSVGMAAGTDRAVGSVKGLMANPDFVPTRSATIHRANGQVLSIVDWDVLEPDGTPILYTIEFRQ